VKGTAGSGEPGRDELHDVTPGVFLNDSAGHWVPHFDVFTFRLQIPKVMGERILPGLPGYVNSAVLFRAPRSQ